MNQIALLDAIVPLTPAYDVPQLLACAAVLEPEARNLPGIAALLTRTARSKILENS